MMKIVHIIIKNDKKTHFKALLIRVLLISSANYHCYSFNFVNLLLAVILEPLQPLGQSKLNHDSSCLSTVRHKITTPSEIA